MLREYGKAGGEKTVQVRRVEGDSQVGWSGCEFSVSRGFSYLADALQCHWLVDVIFFSQPQLRGGLDVQNSLRLAQVWRLDLLGSNNAELSCYTVETLRGGGKPAKIFSEVIYGHDFPLEEGCTVVALNTGLSTCGARNTAFLLASEGKSVSPSWSKENKEKEGEL